MPYQIKFKKINKNELLLILNKKEWVIKLKRKWKLNKNNDSNLLEITYKIFLGKKINKITNKYSFFENWKIIFRFGKNDIFTINIKDRILNEMKYFFNNNKKIQTKISSYISNNLDHFVNKLYLEIMWKEN